MDANKPLGVQAPSPGYTQQRRYDLAYASIDCLSQSEFDQFATVFWEAQGFTHTDLANSAMKVLAKVQITREELQFILFCRSKTSPTSVITAERPNAFREVCLSYGPGIGKCCVYTAPVKLPRRVLSAGELDYLMDQKLYNRMDDPRDKRMRVVQIDGQRRRLGVEVWKLRNGWEAVK